jgi:hypothetical protein
MAAGMMLVLAAAAQAAGPKDTVVAFMAAAAKGDMAAVKKLSTGKVLNAIVEAEKKGPKSVEKMKKFGVGFKEVGDIKQDGDKAEGIVVIDIKKAMTDKEKKKMAMIVALVKAMAAKEKDPAKKASLLAKLKQFESGLLKMKARLVKKGGAWLMSELTKAE